MDNLKYETVDPSEIKKARKHTNTVFILNRIILIVMIASIGIVLYSFRGIIINKSDLDSFSEDSFDIPDASIEIINPMLAGVDNNNENFQINAKNAKNDINQKNLIYLKEIQALMNINTDNTTQIFADKATYDNKRKTLILEDNIIITTASNYVSYMQKASINLNNNSVFSQSPIIIKTPGTCILGNALRITNKGKVLKLKNGINMVFNQDKKSECDKK
ncbi:MAG: LPS export ABC transporter periplasmic protein LptC [Rhodobiaceae bacterium]|jgi:LPS export ABC transporter protein LptC|nr:LPS export ABC transporter periplasmic protein LptC [Rhodobiaceae bacterium]MBT5640268.1 LPS export ABC transporter periplasmic protein LptC [Rhodobiaceae bacterium]MBT6222784.1 LPS export ABC transporter periplasmic protein LptC [Rhodobiaceae bacterium]MDC3272203.1 LPS export ABC transporter periplasmic protein LptC [Hyphomicrobiales bacterium]|tara:strand:+ start:637 stop:1293 length:657 start_codon:yes stop_codon:yes gene_type:complete